MKTNSKVVPRCVQVVLLAAILCGAAYADPLDDVPPIRQGTQGSSANQESNVAVACFDQARVIMCPIVGQIPVLRDVAGIVALQLGFSCPMGPPAGARPAP